MTANRHNSIFYGVDLWTVLLYVLIVMAGWVSITSASYDEGTADVFSFSHFYMKQLMWIGVAWTTAVVVLLLDDRFYHMFAYPAYFAGLALLIGALLFGREVNGAKAWFEFGSFRMQPVEFVKIATALALARVMSAYSFSINRPGDLFKVGIVICIPLFIIVLQNDTGSGIVLGSFLFVLYREGLNKWLCIPVLLIAALFIFSGQRQRSGQFKVICSHRYISFLHFLFIISYQFCCRSSRYRHQTNGIHASISIERQQKTETVTLKLQIAIIKCYAFSTLLLPLSFCLKFSELLFRLLKHVLKDFR